MGQLIVAEFVTVDGVALPHRGPDEGRGGDLAYGGRQALHVNAAAGENLIFAGAKHDGRATAGAQDVRDLRGSGSDGTSPRQGE